MESLGRTYFVFVYGTLKSGEPNHHLLRETGNGVAVLHGQARTVKKWPMVIASRYNVPFLLRCEGKGHSVVGELYQVDDAMMAKLDQLEAYPQFYDRMQEDVILAEGNVLRRAWIYFLTDYKPHLLNLPYLKEYSSNNSQGLQYGVVRVKNHEIHSCSTDTRNSPEDDQFYPRQAMSEVKLGV